MTAHSLTVCYPHSEGARFDFEYWQTTHSDLIHEHMGADLSSLTLIKGLSGPGRGNPMPFAAIAILAYDTEAALAEALAKIGPVAGDIPNYTDIEPQILIGQDL